MNVLFGRGYLIRDLIWELSADRRRILKVDEVEVLDINIKQTCMFLKDRYNTSW